MKMVSCFIGLVMLLITGTNTHLQAQTADTVEITALPVGNLETTINGDTLAGGVRAHPNRVYELRHGSVYQVASPMSINGNVTIIANDTTAGLRPPVLAPFIAIDNSSIDHYFDLNGKDGQVNISNVYFTCFRADGAVLGWADGIRQNADSVNLKLVGDIFEGFTHTALQLNGQWNKMLVEDCVFRNEMHSSAYFGGGAFLSGAPVDMDTTVFVNNTFFCNNSYLWSIRGYAPNAVFNHNTVVYGTVNPFLTRQAQILHINNNIFYGMHAYGGVPEEVIQSDFLNYPDKASSGIIMLRAHDTSSFWTKMWGANITGPEVYLNTGGTGNVQVSAGMLDPAHRYIDILNNDYFQPAALLNFYTQYNDTVATKDSVDMPDGSKQLRLRKLTLPKWMTAYTVFSIGRLDSMGAHVDTSNTMYTDPGFNADIQAQLGKLITYVSKIATTLGPDSAWFYNPTGASQYPPKWPLQENLAYTNTAMQHAGTDGFALGDLNWFPAQKAQWQTTAVTKSSNPVPSTYALSQNYPNPFNPTTTIQYQMPSSGHATLEVYNLLGQRVATLVNGTVPAGTHEVVFDASRLSSGVYFYTLQAGNYLSTKKLVLLK